MQAPQSSGEDGLGGPGGRTAKLSNLSSFSIAASAFAALAGVVFAGIQTFSPHDGKLPINVTLAVDPAATTSDMSIAKSTADAVNIAGKNDGGQPALELAALTLDETTTIASALKDEGSGRYAYRDLFDGRPDTFVRIEAPETELNVMVDLPAVETVGGIEYTPPRNAGGLAPAAVLDVMVLPEGQLEGSGRPVMSFALQTSPGSQTFTLPEKAQGKSLWLRIAGPAGMGDIAIGDLKILKAVR